MKTSCVRLPAVSAAAALLALLFSFPVGPAARADSPAPSYYDSHDDTALGTGALATVTTISLPESETLDNTGIGYMALYSNTFGSVNTAIGSQALYYNTTGNYNTASGCVALFQNTTGSDNTAAGNGAMSFNTTGNDNTASGFQALILNSTGNDNTASGFQALYHNNGTGNLASGVSALYSNTTGNYNVASGVNALYNNTTGGYNIADGENALTRNTTGSSNIGLGHSAGLNLTTGSNNVDIANPGVAAEGSTIRIGTAGTQKNTYVAGISGVTVASGVGVVVDSTGHLGVVTSSARFKDKIQPMAQSSEAIYALQPVTFHYKAELDPAGIPQYGLVAEELEKVDPNLVARDAEGKAYTVRYEAVNAMLLNEFLKERRQVRAQQDTIVQLRADLDAQRRASDTQRQSLEAQRDELRDLAVLVRGRPTP